MVSDIDSSSSWWSAPTALCDLPCIGELRPVAVLDEAHRERLHRLAHIARHHGDEEARVEPSAQHGPERDVAHQAELHGLLELLAQQLRGTWPP